MPVLVFIDTSLLKYLNPHGVLGQLVRNLSIRGAIQLHVADIVEREVAFGIAQEAPTALDRKCSAALAWAACTGMPTLQEVKDVHELIRRAKERAASGVSAWLDSVSAVRHCVSSAGVSSTLDAYFAGMPPFKESRSREDLPDGLIASCVSEFAAAHTNASVHFLVEDKRLGKAFSSVPNVQVHSGWSTFLKHKDLSGQEDARFRALLVANGSPLPGRLTDAIESYIQGKWRTLSIGSSDEQEVLITDTGTVTFDFGSVDGTSIDEDTVEVPFSCTLSNCSANVFILKSEYFAEADDSAHRLIDGDWNSHVVLAEVDIELSIDGSFIVTMGHADNGAPRLKDAEVLDVYEISASPISRGMGRGRQRNKLPR